MSKRKRSTHAPKGPRKRQRRPIGDKFPPRPDLEGMSFGAAMHMALNSGPVDISKEPTEWRCVDCGRQVWYPEVYYNDNRCEQCHVKAQQG